MLLFAESVGELLGLDDVMKLMMIVVVKYRRTCRVATRRLYQIGRARRGGRRVGDHVILDHVGRGR